MNALKLPSFLLVSGSLSLALAAGPSIGFAVAGGALQIDSARVNGNATLFEGTAVRTANASSDLVLSGGARLRLGPDSEARIYRDRLVLSGGRARLESSAAPFSIDAQGLRVRPNSSEGSLDVAVRSRAVEVAAVRGSAVVSGSGGAVLANVPAGSALSLEPQAAGASAATQISGTLRLSGGTYTVSDTVTNVVFTLTGTGLDKFVDQCVNVTGSSTGTPAALRVLSIAACGKPAAAAPTGQGISTRTKVLIAGVAVGSTAATIGITGTKKDKRPKPSRDK